VVIHDSLSNNAAVRHCRSGPDRATQQVVDGSWACSQLFLQTAVAAIDRHHHDRETDLAKAQPLRRGRRAWLAQLSLGM
jgi:hypothetical protein